MQIKNIELISFRNYDRAVFDFSANNLIVGPNGSGKTSILEAIDILATTKSSIARGINKCIKAQQKGFIISAAFSGHQDFKIVFKQERNVSRTIKLNENILDRSTELLGLVNSVIFLPQDIELIQGPPQLRRKYLDVLISQAEKNYYESLQLYAKVLSQRNETLKMIQRQAAKENLLEPWDEQLQELSGKIFRQRRDYLTKLSEIIQSLYQRIGISSNVELKYKTEITGEKTTDLKKIISNRRIELMTGFTNFGPHRDDLVFMVEETSAQDYCSQGQQRLLVLCLKLAEAAVKKEKLNDNPILLIDDVLLELDLERFNKIIKETLADSQKIFTVTDTKRFDPDLLKQLHCIELTTERN